MHKETFFKKPVGIVCEITQDGADLWECTLTFWRLNYFFLILAHLYIKCE
jgi:hypothetical protein